MNTVSGHAFDPKADGSAAYAAAKGAIFSFTLAAALEAAPLGVAVNAVAPLAYTAMSEEYLSAVPGAAEALDPAHVSRVLVELLAAPLSVTGRVFRIEGERVGEYRVTLSELVATERMGEVLGA